MYVYRYVYMQICMKNTIDNYFFFWHLALTPLTKKV